MKYRCDKKIWYGNRIDLFEILKPWGIARQEDTIILINVNALKKDSDLRVLNLWSIGKYRVGCVGKGLFVNCDTETRADLYKIGRKGNVTPKQIKTRTAHSDSMAW